MGGKNGVLVLDDADARKAAKVVAAGAFGLTGQACTATSRVYVTPGIRSAFLDALAEEAAAYIPGDGLDAAHGRRRCAASSSHRTPRRCGPPSNAAPRCWPVPGSWTKRTTATRTVRCSSPPLCSPSLPFDDAAVTEEIFGPVVAVLEVADYEAGLAAINDSRYGLTAGICTIRWPAPRTSLRGPRPAWSRSTGRRRAWT